MAENCNARGRSCQRRRIPRLRCATPRRRAAEPRDLPSHSAAEPRDRLQQEGPTRAGHSSTPSRAAPSAARLLLRRRLLLVLLRLLGFPLLRLVSLGHG